MASTGTLSGGRRVLFRGAGVGLFTTIDLIVENPVRSRTWKVVDVTALCALWGALALSVALWLGDDSDSWVVAVKILIPVTSLATARGWYRHPRRSRRVSDEAARRQALESGWVPPTGQPTDPDQA